MRGGIDMSHRTRAAILFLLLTFSASLHLRAQSQANTANLEGTIKDQTGAVLPGVTVAATNKEVSLTRTAVSNDQGLYQIPVLPPGTYDVRAELTGFAPQIKQGVTLSVGQFATVDFTLSVSATSTEVVVQENAQILEVSKTQQSETINQLQIDNLPINGRNYLDFTLLTPGVSGRNPMVRTAVQTPTSGLSFNGQNGRGNTITIDGVNNIDSISNSSLSTLSQEGINEFQINRNSFSAEFGRAQGGVINIVTKSGSNTAHGNAFYFIRDKRLDARNTFAIGPDKPQFQRKQWGGTFGGPLAKDSIFLFASFERLDRRESLFVTFLNDPRIFGLTDSQKQLFDFLAQAPVPSLRQLATALTHPQVGVLNTTAATFPSTLNLFRRESGTFPFKADQNTFSLKNDFLLSNDNQLFTRFSMTRGANDNTEFGGLKGVSNGVSFDTDDTSFVISDTHVVDPRRLNEFKFQVARRENKVSTNDPTGPNLTLTGVADFGREFFNPTRYTERLHELIDNFTFILGNHTFKTGADYNLTLVRGTAEVFLGGRFIFSGSSIPLGLVINNLAGSDTAATGIGSALAQLGRADLIPNLSAPISAVQSFNFGLPTSFFQGFGNPFTRFRYTQFGTYFQDSWKMRRNFTLNLGLRFDVELRPKTSNVINNTPPFQFDFRSVNDTNNLAPRIGFSWSPGSSEKAVIRGGYGIYYAGSYNAIAFVSQVLSGQISQVFVPLTGLPGTPATSATVFADFRKNGPLTADRLTALGLPPGRTPSIILPQASDVESPYSHQASLGMEHELLKDLALSIDYNFNRGLHIIRSRDINVRQTGPNKFTLPGLDPRFVQINQIESTGVSTYHGLTVSGRKRFSHNHAYQVSYTFGKAVDDATDFITPLQPNNQRDLRSEKSLSSFDERQRLVISGVLVSRVESDSPLAKNFLSGWILSPIFTYSSGRPFNLLVGFDANGDTHDETDRPALSNGQIAGRNTGRGPNFISTDLRLARKISLQPEGRVNLELIAEAFNLFNRANFAGVNNVVGFSLSSFDVEGRRGSPTLPLGFTSAYDPRQIQFGVKLNF
jgi:hypothetical protein